MALVVSVGCRCGTGQSLGFWGLVFCSDLCYAQFVAKKRTSDGKASKRSQCPGCVALQSQVAQLSALVDELRQRDAAMQQRLEELERQAHRQAAPFRRPQEKRGGSGKPPGRPKGHPPSHRPKPPDIDEHVIVLLERCPHCNAKVTDQQAVEQIIQDLPPVRIHNLHLTTYRGKCPNCGPVCSTHPAQVSTATGAAGVHLGKNILGLIASLSKAHGLTMRRLCKILNEHFGLSISPGGVSQALDRVADRLSEPYGQLQDAVRKSLAIHVDETGWWVNGHSQWLWVFTNGLLTLYEIDNRSQEVVRRVLGDDYLGVLISDCLATYDPHPGRKSKCVAHHLKAINEALTEAPESVFLQAIKRFWQGAIAVHRMRSSLDTEQYAKAVAALEDRLHELLGTPCTLSQELRIINRLRKQDPHLLTFLHVSGVDPTNNQAERQLRPAVIARKLSAGNKTARGVRTFQTLASLAATCAQQGRSFGELVADWLSVTGPPPEPLQLTAPD